MVVPYMLEEWQREDDIVTMDEHNVVKAVGKYVLKQTLGKGSMGKVKLGIHVVTGEKAAIKIVPRTTRNRQLTPKELSRELRAVREGHLMMLMNHPHIVYLRDMFAGSHHYYFMMDYVSGGQLLHYIVKRTHLSEKHSRHFCRQMVSALDYMHRNSVVHRDLKIENILVDRTGRNIKIIDFGLSNLFCPERQLTTYCGSLYFAAPELLNGRPYRGPEIDVWSLGVVLYVMVTGSVPFDDKSLPGLHEKIKRAQVAYPAHLSAQCHDLLSSILIADPQQRITLADIIRHPWLNEGRSGHTRNYLLFREPLSLPLDENVLEKMTFGFNLGTVDDIRMKMEVILQSSVYRVSATHVSEMQSLHMINQHNDGISPASVLSKPQQQQRPIKPNTGALKSINRTANHLIWGTYSDPQTVPAAYHPLLSIYYLTMERMQRLENLEPGVPTTTVSSTTLENTSVKKSAPQQPVTASSPSPLYCLENNSVNIVSKHNVPSQQQLLRQYQPHTHHDLSGNTLKENTEQDENGFTHSRHSMDSTYHVTQVLADYRNLHHDDNHSRGMLPPLHLPMNTTIKREAHPSSNVSISSLAHKPNVQTMRSPSHSPSPSSLSLASLVLPTSDSKLSALSPPSIPQTLPSALSSIHLPLQNAIHSSKTTTTSASSTRKNTQLLTRLGALFRRRKSRYQHHPHPYEHQDRHHRHHRNPSTPCHSHRRVSVSLPSPQPKLESDSQTIFTDTSELPPIPSPTLHFQHDLYQLQPTLSPATSFFSTSLLSSKSTSSTRSPPDTRVVVGPSGNNVKNGTDTSNVRMEKLPETCGHERSPSWLGRTLSAWMERAPILNRSTLGLEESIQH